MSTCVNHHLLHLAKKHRMYKPSFGKLMSLYITGITERFRAAWAPCPKIKRWRKPRFCNTELGLRNGVSKISKGYLFSSSAFRSFNPICGISLPTASDPAQPTGLPKNRAPKDKGSRGSFANPKRGAWVDVPPNDPTKACKVWLAAGMHTK